MKTVTIVLLTLLWNSNLFAGINVGTEKVNVNIQCSHLDADESENPYYCTYGKLKKAAEKIAKKHNATLLGYEITKAPEGFKVGDHYQSARSNQLEVTVKYLK